MDPRIKNTCKEMIVQRGYQIQEEEETYIIGINNSLEENNQIYVILISTLKFNIEKLTEYINIMNNVNIKHGIIIYRDSATPIAKKMVQNNTNMYIELFREEELLYNITKHSLVPIHEFLSDSDILAFKKKFGVKIPIILSTDAIVRFYNFKKGSIIRVIRKDDYVSYRIVR